MAERRVVTTFAIEIRTQELLRLIDEHGYTTRRPNSEDPNYTIVNPAGDALVIPHMGAGTTVFGHILSGLEHQFAWTTVDLYKVRLRAMFARNADRRNKKRAATANWTPERAKELTERAYQMMEDCRMNLPVVMIDEDKAYDILLDHDLATKARGLLVEGDPSTQHLADDPASLRQRRLRNPKVEELAQAQLDGEWELHHQGLARAEDRYLLDGQHRLWAVTMSGIPCPMVLAENVPERGISAMDNTEKRNGVDALSMIGVQHPAQAHPALRLLHFIDHYPQDRTKWLTYTLRPPQLRAEVLAHYRDIAESVRVGYKVSCSADTKLTASALIAAHYVIQRACKGVWPEAPITEFFDSIMNDDLDPYWHNLYPSGVAKQSPVRQLNSWSRKWDTRATSEVRGKNDKPIEHYCQIMSAWEDMNRGEHWSRPQYQRKAKTPLPYVYGDEQ